mmetsp:Transcript_23450/g.50827  ORF Transcript_23450/g.50827 Transcript_23450/m.50827 type:complete len:161 (+) Transcript_23450:293-775(+)|eukprot:CAMPEP_0168736952 /NCGR_PEP_ID=MMETSP0724-20121128/10130_1 /TAXON_ID=265536 /ORGANISM="Amphiprora sp., Strain CCMP467" /LENGTH=160 /DNA_ID=CAMNT_0008784175 /DNA_START=214 /DNA_END=696 /DNA_ORIENTATION=-
MVKALSYTTISHIIESWELIRQTKDYEKTVGTYLFQYLFKRCPDAKVLFGFHIDVDTDSPKLLESKRFLTHAKYLVQMLDTAFNMLGPDDALLTDIMIDLGGKHRRYGVKAEMLPVMGEAVLRALELCLQDKFTQEDEKAWKETFAELSNDMIKGMAQMG